MTQTVTAPLKPVVIGLTGSLGSGKSEAAKIFRELGAEIVDADIIAREVVVPGSPGLKSITARFGSEVLLPSGELNRKILGSIVFADPTARKALEDILHPLIRERFLGRISELKLNTPLPRIIVYAVPLLFESRYGYEEIDKIVVVSAPESVCLARVMARDGLSRDEALRRYRTQLPIEQKKAKADYVIENVGDLKALKSQIEEIASKLIN